MMEDDEKKISGLWERFLKKKSLKSIKRIKNNHVVGSSFPNIFPPPLFLLNKKVKKMSENPVEPAAGLELLQTPVVAESREREEPEREAKRYFSQYFFLSLHCSFIFTPIFSKAQAR